MWNITTDNEEWNDVSGIFNKAFFPFFCLILSLVLDGTTVWLDQKIGIRIPSTVCQMLASLGLTVILYLVWEKDKFTGFLNDYTWISLSPENIMVAVLPVLIFEAAFKIEAEEFLHSLPILLFLSVICFLVATVLTGAVVYTLENLWREYPEWTFYVSLLFGSLISATDPVAVVALLKELGCPHDLSLAIEGESLMNDGAAIIAYGIFREIVYEQAGKEAEWPIGVRITVVFIMVFVSILLAVVVANVTVWFISTGIKDSVKERGILLIAVYVTYIVCEKSDGSGVLGLVFLAVLLNRNKDKLSTEAAKDNLTMWELLAYWANGVVFTITGIMCGKVLFTHAATHYERRDRWDYLYLVIIYVSVIVVRFVALVPAWVIFRNKTHRISLDLKYITIMWWGGLRGVVALLLTMKLADDSAFDKEVIGERAMVYVGAIVIATLLIQATTTRHIIQRFGLDRISRYRQNIMADIVNSFNNQLERAILSIRQISPALSETNWDAFLEMARIRNPYKGDGHGKVSDCVERRTLVGDGADVTVTAIKDSDSSSTGRVADSDKSEQDKPDEGVVDESDLTNEGVKGELSHRITSMLVANLRNLCETGMLTDEGLKLLSASIKQYHDFADYDVTKAIDSWSVPARLLPLNDILESNRKAFAEFLSNHPIIRKYFYNYPNDIVAHDLQDILGYIVFMVHITLVILAVVTLEGTNDTSLRLYEFLKAVFCMYHIVDNVVKIHVGCKIYFSSRPIFWAALDLLYFLFYCVDLVIKIFSIRMCYMGRDLFSLRRFDGSYLCQTFFYFEFILLFRLVIIAHFMVLVIGAIRKILKRFVSQRIATILSALNAFSMAIEDLNKSLTTYDIFRNQEYLRPLINNQILKNNEKRKQAQIEMAKLQYNYPDVSITTKTQASSSAFLHVVQAHVDSMTADGEIEESEAALLKKQIKAQMQALTEQLSIPHLELRPALRYHPVFVGFSDDFLDITEPEMIAVDSGHVLVKQGEESNRMFYLHKGTAIVRIQWKDHGTTEFVELPLHPGSLIGELGMLFDEPRSADIAALTPCKFFWFSKEAVQKALAKLPVVEGSLIKQLCIRRSADFMRKLPVYRNWTELRINNLLSNGRTMDLHNDPRYQSVDMSSCSHILLIRGSIFDGLGTLMETKFLPKEVHTSRFRNACPENHCLIFIVPREQFDHHSGRLFGAPMRNKEVDRLVSHDTSQQNSNEYNATDSSKAQRFFSSTQIANPQSKQDHNNTDDNTLDEIES